MTSGAFMMSVVMYGIVTHSFGLVAAPFEGFARSPDGLPLRYAFWAVVLALIVVLPVVRRGLLTKAAGEDARSSTARLVRTSMVTNAISEVPALLGVVLVALNGLYLDFYMLALLSIGLMGTYFPRYEAWEDWLRERAPRP